MGSGYYLPSVKAANHPICSRTRELVIFQKPILNAADAPVNRNLIEMANRAFVFMRRRFGY